MIDLYPDQKRAMSALGSAMHRSKRVIFKLPTGGGKTVIAAKLAEIALKRGKRMCFVVDAISLIDQTVERFAQFGIHEVGVIQASHPATDYSQPIQVASIQTLSRRNVLDYQHFDIVVVDEAHCQYKFLIEWMTRWSNIPFVGLTATPYAKGMGKHWHELVVGGTIADLIREERLSPYRIFAVSHPDLKGVKVRGGDYVESELSERMREGALVNRPVQHWLKHAKDLPTLAFCVDRVHAKFTQSEFEAAGISCAYVDAYTDREERQVIADKFHAGEYQVVASVGCLTKGVDWDVRCILLLRPTKSEMLYLQIIGRGLRKAEGKDYCLILDHSDTAMRLGFPEEVDEANVVLDDGERGDTPERPQDPPQKKPCPKCKFLKPPKTHACPVCGFKPEPVHEGQTIDAELEELIPKAKRKLNRETTPEQKGKFFAGLQGYADQKGFKKGWAAYQYKEKFGVWPNAYKDVQAQPPGDMVMAWVKHQNIKYAKRRKQ
jgi:DNA repair protein RadD